MSDHRTSYQLQSHHVADTSHKDTDNTTQPKQALLMDIPAEPGLRDSSHADCDVLHQLQDSAPKDDFLENSQGSQDNISPETPELEPISPDTLSLSPTSPLLSFSQKMEELSLQALFVASPQISTKKRRAAQPPKTADPALPPPPVRAIRHARAQTFLHQLQMNQKQLITALSDMCRVPAILAATITNIYRTSGNPVCL